MTVPDIVKDWLEQHAEDYDGLTDNEGCCCLTDALMPCVDAYTECDCRAGHICGSDEDGDIVFTAGPRPEAAT